MASGRAWSTRLIGVLVTMAAGVMLVLSAMMTIQCVHAMTFRPVGGTVVAKRLKSTVAGRINLHEPVIEYSYVVGGVRYRNDAFTLTEADGGEEWARSILQAYPVGAPCTVYYDPFNPRTSVLSTSPTSRVVWLTILMTFLGAIHLPVGIMMARGTP